MKVYPIPQPLFEAVMQYLITRPYKEVGQAIPALASVQPIEQPDEKEEER